MATVTIAIRTTAADYASTRPTSIMLTATQALPSVSLYDVNGDLISVLLNVESGTKYSIMNGLVSEAGVPEYLVPAPIYAIEFTTDDADPVHVTGIAFSLNVLDDDRQLVLNEVADSRLTGDPADSIVVGGTGVNISETGDDLLIIVGNSKVKIKKNGTNPPTITVGGIALTLINGVATFVTADGTTATVTVDGLTVTITDAGVDTVVTMAGDDPVLNPAIIESDTVVGGTKVKVSNDGTAPQVVTIVGGTPSTITLVNGAGSFTAADDTTVTVTVVGSTVTLTNAGIDVVITAPPTTGIKGTSASFASIRDFADFYPAFGVNLVSKRIDYGIVNQPIAKRMRGEV